MSRVKRGTTVKARHKNVLKNTKGFRHGRKNLIKLAKQADTKAGQYAYRDRRNKKRDFRRLWIVQINAGCKINDIKYSIFMNALKRAEIELDRKILADLAEHEPGEFKKLVEKVKA